MELIVVVSIYVNQVVVSCLTLYLLQTSMNVLNKGTTVAKLQNALMLLDHIFVAVKMAFREMDLIVRVSTCIW